EPGDLHEGVDPHDLVPQHPVVSAADERWEVLDEPAPSTEGGGHAGHLAAAPAAPAGRSVEVVAADDGPAGCTGHAGCTERAALVGEGGDGDGPPTVDLADHVGVRHTSVGQEHLVEGGTTRHLLERPHVDAGLVHV